ncbi:MAG: DnaD domain protein [Bacilli bacterium]|nr:DnaD domain protein [Bacilli bacterium]
MKNQILNNVIKVNDSLIIPGYIIKYFDKLDLDGLNLILLLYFINQKENITFNITKISSDLNIESSRVLELINELNEKNYIAIEMRKNDTGVIEEFISTDLFFNKISSLLMENQENTENNDIYSVFEKEFGRVLSPTEVEIVNKWTESSISEEMIKEALKEAVLNGVHNMRYIDSILFNWTKKGYKKVEDIKRKKNIKEDTPEVYDYDWLNE